MILKSKRLEYRDLIPINKILLAIEYLINLKINSDFKNIINLGGGITLSIVEVANLIQKRCEILFNYKPDIIKNISDDNLFYNQEKFSYKSIVLEKLGFNYPSDINKEIDSLLLFCKDNFKN